LAATLDHDASPWRSGEVPPLGHWLYFLPQAPHREISEDGHPHRGGFLPPVSLPRRMWAGGDLRFHTPIRVGEALRRRSTIAEVEHKSGRSGTLVFVKVVHEIMTERGLAVREVHDIVYRDAPKPGEVAPAGETAKAAMDWERPIIGDPVLLFRFSALTFNGHRIHYDRKYCEEVEGYPGLIVHGPLLATLLARIIHEARSRRTGIPENQGLTSKLKSGAWAVFSSQSPVLASSIGRRVMSNQRLSRCALFRPTSRQPPKPSALDASQKQCQPIDIIARLPP
jgi:hydroxyacyl-ACP dehydratase HTD2-like protein with hotdog domain